MKINFLSKRLKIAFFGLQMKITFLNPKFSPKNQFFVLKIRIFLIYSPISMGSFYHFASLGYIYLLFLENQRQLSNFEPETWNFIDWTATFTDWYYWRYCNGCIIWIWCGECTLYVHDDFYKTCMYFDVNFCGFKNWDKKLLVVKNFFGHFIFKK